jgi:hypothetical protein
MAEPIKASDQAIAEQLAFLRKLKEEFDSDWQPQRIANFALGTGGLPIGEYHVLLPGSNFGDGQNVVFNAVAVQNGFSGLASSVSAKFKDIAGNLATQMMNLMAAGNGFDDAESKADGAAKK